MKTKELTHNDILV